MQNAKLNELHELLGRDQASALIGRLAAELESGARRLDRDQQAPPLAADHAHRLVAVAGALGLKDLAEQFAQLERLCRSKGADAQETAVAITSLVGQATRVAGMLDDGMAQG